MLIYYAILIRIEYCSRGHTHNSQSLLGILVWQRKLISGGLEPQIMMRC